MSKTLETKKKILNLLNRKEMTISELSKELDLSTATISQHMDELQSVGAVEKVNSEYFKKLKYYKAKETESSLASRYLKYAIGAIVVLVAFSGVYLYGLRGANIQHPLSTTIAQGANNSNVSNSSVGVTSTPGSPGPHVAFSCIVYFYQINGSISNSTGFAVYYLNSSSGKVADYVIGDGTNGTLHINENLSNVLSEPANSTLHDREHYAFLTQMNQSFNSTSPGVNVTVSPQNYTVYTNESVSLNVSVAVNSTATKNTYWLRIDGPCGGGVAPVLITVGNKPYNGTVQSQVLTYQ